MIYGSTDIDGYAFCSGLKSLWKSQKLSYTASSELHSLPSLIDLIERAGLRPKYTTNLLERYSLEIRSLAELVDMFHTRKATDVRDKVYALLGMSSDYPNKAGLQPDYQVPWNKLFKDLVKFILGKDISVQTSDSTQRAVITSKGCVLGRLSLERSDNRQNINITFISKNVAWCLDEKMEWTLQVASKSIREQDIVCLLKGASKPTIIRMCKDHFAIVVIAVAPLKESRGFQKLLELSKSVTHFMRDFQLVWDWEQLLEESQDRVESKNWMSFDEASRTWNVALILEDLEEYEKAEKRRREAIEGYEMAIREEHPCMLKSQYGLTPLSWAAGNGYDGLVSLLLANDSVDPDLKDSQYGRTPLSWAASGGYEAVVKLLLQTGKVNVESTDKDGTTILWGAVCGGHEAVVLLLLDTGKINIESTDKDGTILLWWAVQGGREAVVKLLLKTSKIDINSKDKHGQTLLLVAIQEGHDAVVKLLLETGKVDVNSKDSCGQTPLLVAVRGNHEAIVKLLLETGKVDVNSEDWRGRTPLLVAVRGNHETIVKLLLETGKVDVDSKAQIGRTPLWWAVWDGREAMVRLMLETGKVDISSKDSNGQMLLRMAERRGHDALVELLRSSTR
jgi:ankyrin repeat protein